MSERGRATFIVRMWSEPGTSGEPAWRGSVENVATRNFFYFSNIGAMCEFMLTERERDDRTVLRPDR